MGERAAIGLVAAAIVATLARMSRSLSRSGAVAATALGAVTTAAGYDWAALLVVYFAASTMLTRLGASEKERRTRGVAAKGGQRDARQVLANGGVFGAAALGMLIQPDVVWAVLGIASLAASAADTWATEIGTWFGGVPRSILGWKPVPVGTSGGVSVIGSMGAAAGAVFVGLVALAAGWTRHVAAAAVLGGVAGTLVDSLAGATIQARRWCERCQLATERVLHECGEATRLTGGLAGFDNDMVNLAGVIAGGVVATALYVTVLS